MGERPIEGRSDGRELFPVRAVADTLLDQDGEPGGSCPPGERDRLPERHRLRAGRERDRTDALHDDRASVGALASVPIRDGARNDCDVLMALHRTESSSCRMPSTAEVSTRDSGVLFTNVTVSPSATVTSRRVGARRGERDRDAGGQAVPGHARDGDDDRRGKRCASMLSLILHSGVSERLEPPLDLAARLRQRRAHLREAQARSR